MGDVFQPLEMLGPEGVQAEIKNLEFEYTLKGETIANVSSTPYIGVCLARPWNGRPTLKQLQVKQISLWPSFGGAWRHVPLN